MNSDMMMSSMRSERDYEFARVLVGDADSLRGRLAEAAERLGYRVVSRHPVVARRKARGAGRSGCSADILEYPTELVITLRPLSAAATHATFAYTVKNYAYAARGDERTLESEADAIAALARSTSAPAACSACGAEASDDSRFCRRCGAPLVSEEPAEVEVMRLTAGTRAAYKGIRMGLFGVLMCVLVALFMLFVAGGKSLDVAQVVLVAVGFATLFTLLAGLWRLYRTLNGERDETFAPAAEPARVPPVPRTSALPPAPAQVSITEGTTELLEKEKVKAER